MIGYTNKWKESSYCNFQISSQAFTFIESKLINPLNTHSNQKQVSKEHETVINAHSLAILAHANFRSILKAYPI